MRECEEYANKCSLYYGNEYNSNVLLCPVGMLGPLKTARNQEQRKKMKIKKIHKFWFIVSLVAAFRTTTIRSATMADERCQINVISFVWCFAFGQNCLFLFAMAVISGCIKLSKLAVYYVNNIGICIFRDYLGALGIGIYRGGLGIEDSASGKHQNLWDSVDYGANLFNVRCSERLAYSPCGSSVIYYSIVNPVRDQLNNKKNYQEKNIVNFKCQY